jgi:lysine 2,3-aminomutase
VARLLQEQKEEARLLPGTKRTDEVVYNVPGLGKNYLRALQHRDLISVLPDGSRVYEFHPWEKNIIKRSTYVGTDIPVLTYLLRLEARGENAADYSSIWYYF